MQSVHVVVGIILNAARDQVLVACRPEGKPLAGFWEFPGGKLEAGESPWQGLARELMEEVNITPLAGDPLMTVTQDLNDKTFLLDVWLITAFQGEPFGCENQALKWMLISDIDQLQFPPANESIVRRLQAMFIAS